MSGFQKPRNSGKTERDPLTGHFVQGCPPGPGRPKGSRGSWRFRRMRELLHAAVDDLAFAEVCAKLVDMAKGGDIQAIKLVMSYQVGRPVPMDDAERYESCDAEMATFEEPFGGGTDYDTDDGDDADADGDADGDDFRFVTADEMLANLPQESLGD